MIFDTITIIACGTLVVLALLSCLTDVFFRKISNTESDGIKRDGIPISVIIISDNNARELAANLESYISQDYPYGYEIIVVVCKDDDGTSDVLNTFANRADLHVTFVPDSSRYMSKRKLAVTLGVKAAKNEWILLTDAVCRPLSDKWISSMASHISESAPIVFGYSGYDADAGKFKSFMRLRKEFLNMLMASQGRPYGMEGNNLMFRKSVFMSGKGYQGNLKYIRGEYDFLVNKYGDGEIPVNISSDGRLCEIAPTKKEWHNKNMFYVETRKHLNGKFIHHVISNMDILSLYLCSFLSVIAIIYSSFVQNWIILAFGIFSFVVPFAVRTVNAGRVLRKFGSAIPLFAVIPFEFCIFWHNVKYIIRYWFADKDEFISHKS